MNSTVTHSPKIELGNFYTTNYSRLLYRYVGMYGQKRVFMQYGFDCTDRSGTWFFRCKNTLVCVNPSFDRQWIPVSIDSNGRFTLMEDIKCELLHNLYEFEVIK